MSINSNSVVVYDACILYPATLRDLLVQLALARIVHASRHDLFPTISTITNSAI